MTDLIETVRAIIKEKRDEYYVGTFSAANNPVAAYRFSDHERVTPFGHAEDAQKWIDEQASAAVIRAIFDPTNETQVAALALAGFELERDYWDSAEFSQHESRLREWARMTLGKLGGGVAIIDSRRLETAANEVARIWPAYRLYHDQNYAALCQAMRGLENAMEIDDANA